MVKISSNMISTIQIAIYKTKKRAKYLAKETKENTISQALVNFSRSIYS